MFPKTRILALSIAVTAAMAAGCGGSDDADPVTVDPPPPAVTTLSGYFVDSAVGGIGYETDTQDGETTAEGEFEYVDGETVTFFIGDLALPAVAGGELITPMDLFETTDITDQRVVNLARLLQSLDEDGDPSNGITLTEAAHAAATGVDIDLDVSTEAFAANTDVINLVSNGGGQGTLVSAEDALAHLEQVTIVGTWTVADEPVYLAATFMADGTYMIAEGEEADDAGEPGLEYGTYEWDYLTGEINVEVETDTNGEWGLSHPGENLTLVRTGNEITFTETIDGVADVATFAKVASSENPLIGSWMLKEEGVVVIFTFTETHYAHAEAAEADDFGFTGPEFGTYTWNQETGALTWVTEVDLNGDWGFSHETEQTSIAIDGDTMELTFGPDGSEGGATLTRVR